MTDTEAKIEEAKRKIEEANQQLKTAKAQEQKDSPNKHDHKKTSEKSSFISNLKFFKHDEDGHEETEESNHAPLEIGMPTNIVHEGHIGYDAQEGGLKLRNLPPAYKELFSNLNKTLESMGVSTLTEKEVKFLLRSLPAVVATSHDEPKNNKKKGTTKGKPSKDKTEQHINDLELIKKQLSAQVETLEHALNEARDIIRSKDREILSLKESNAKFQLEVMANKNPSSDIDSKINNEMKKFYEQLDQRDQKIKTLTEENDQLKVGLAQMKIINIERADNNKLPGETVSPIRSMKKKGETVRLSGQSKSQLRSAVASTSGAPVPPPMRPSPAAASNDVPAPPAAPDAPPPPPSGAPVPKALPTPPKKKKEKESPAPASSRDAILDNIKKGHKLRHVSEEEKQKPDLNLNDQNVLNLIAKALIDRRNVIKDDQEDEAEDDNLEDWL